jgi:hypothetical protein
MIAEQLGNDRANSETIEQWSAYLEELHARIAHHFLIRAEVRERAYRYLSGLLADVRRKNSWQMAEAIGEMTPRGGTTSPKRRSLGPRIRARGPP